MDLEFVRFVFIGLKELTGEKDMKTLDRNERRVLLRKYIDNGLEFREAMKRVNKFHSYLKDMQKKLSAMGKKDKDIEIKFKQEFWKLCCSLEV